MSKILLPAKSMFASTHFLLALANISEQFVPARKSVYLPARKAKHCTFKSDTPLSVNKFIRRSSLLEDRPKKEIYCFAETNAVSTLF
jgi:hypothetical protein